MRTVEFTRQADREFDNALETSRRRFGLRAADNYAALFQAAFDAIAEDPLRPSSQAVARRGRHVRSYALRFARAMVQADGRVGRPRHVIYYESINDRVHVLRIVHDSMDQRRLRLPRVDRL